MPSPVLSCLILVLTYQPIPQNLQQQPLHISIIEGGYIPLNTEAQALRACILPTMTNYQEPPAEAAQGSAVADPEANFRLGTRVHALFRDLEAAQRRREIVELDYINATPPPVGSRYAYHGLAVEIQGLGIQIDGLRGQLQGIIFHDSDIVYQLGLVNYMTEMGELVEDGTMPRIHPRLSFGLRLPSHPPRAIPVSWTFRTGPLPHFDFSSHQRQSTARESIYHPVYRPQASSSMVANRGPSAYVNPFPSQPPYIGNLINVSGSTQPPVAHSSTSHPATYSNGDLENEADRSVTMSDRVWLAEMDSRGSSSESRIADQGRQLPPLPPLRHTRSRGDDSDREEEHPRSCYDQEENWSSEGNSATQSDRDAMAVMDEERYATRQSPLRLTNPFTDPENAVHDEDENEGESEGSSESGRPQKRACHNDD